HRHLHYAGMTNGSFFISDCLHLCMLTVTEFFNKKKIDIQAMKNAKPDLYSEFERDYTEMGEKSFDHSKKFWFNKLRHQFLLEEVDGGRAQTQSAANENLNKGNKVAAKPTGFRPKNTGAVAAKHHHVGDSGDTASPSLEESSSKPSGFTPRFKGKTNPAEKPSSADQVSEQPSGSSAASKPSGFTPRFKGKANPAEKPSSEEQVRAPPSGSGPPSKPSAFTPRFKGKTNPAEKPSSADQVSEQPSESSPASKPSGFTPRFKGKAITTGKPSSEEQVSERPSGSSPTSKPLGFTPRFKGTKNTDKTGSDITKDKESRVRSEEERDVRSPLDDQVPSRRENNSDQDSPDKP